MPTPVKFRSNSEVAIHVPDLDRAEEFYADVLGFTLVRKTAEQLEFDTGVLRLYVNQDSNKQTYVPSLDVDNYAEAREYLEAAGCKTVSIDGTDLVYFQDPYGFVFDIVERPPS
jgi:catechol 2,3-dioxygenase-like lactoylglutathione lyase family enzyme